ncbi:MAG: DUF4032 domain-containing protein [Herpetosiphon sp.]|nr:DUF4032 domain-containing protein [Herpetosiphon sp.]
MGYNGWINGQVDSDYEKARFSATLNNIVNLLRDEPRTLLPFEEVRSRINIRGQVDRGIQVVPLKAIIGSEGRYSDFDRQFLPRHQVTKERWKNIDRARYSDVALPPIELYKIDDVYFVRDGNHRVSVARQQGQADIEAHVIELVSDVDIDPDMTTDDLAKLEEQSDFLEWTHLAQLRPDQDIEISQPGGYLDMIRQINGHRYFKSLELGRELTKEEAVTSWYDTLYKPIVEAIQSTGVLAAFPNRTPADLYLWIMDHRHYLTQTDGFDPGAQEAVLDYTRHYAERKDKVQLPPPPSKAETEFLEWSQLGRLRPSVRIPLSDDKDYARLRLHILDHQYFLGKNLGRDVSFEEASQSWFDTVYETIARAAIEQGAGEMFPKTTLGDVYLLITDYLHYKRGQGVEIDPVQATREYTKQFGKERASFLTGILHRARRILRFSLIAA